MLHMKTLELQMLLGFSQRAKLCKVLFVMSQKTFISTSNISILISFHDD